MTTSSSSSVFDSHLLQADVVILGGGNAALCAAICARERGASVIVLESAPWEYRGGNSRHTRNLRGMHEAPTTILTDTYSEQEYFEDLWRVTGGRTNETLARMVIASSARSIEWMRAHGARFQPALSGTLQLGRTNAFFLGGGKALMNTYYELALKLGVQIFYNAEVVDLQIEDGKFIHASFMQNGLVGRAFGRTLVAAAGGFEANLLWLRKVWGAAADNFIVRGTPYNKGKVLELLLACGAHPIGDEKQCHAVAIDARAPKFDGGIVTRLDCVPLGVVVNQNGERFYDEGEDFWPKRYAVWGRLVADQPGQIAYSITDAKMIGQFMPSVFPAVQAESISQLAQALGLPTDQVVTTISAFNARVRSGTFDPTVLDDCSTSGLNPQKSHWAVPIDTPPFFGYPLRPGITFTYLGIEVDRDAAMVMSGGARARNIFAAGEIMAGNILGQGYLAGIGMTIGTVFGQIAGERQPGMPFANALEEGERIMRICNACRYCEGYCAVFPAMEKRIVFARGDLNYLANLCHDCGECYHACQYAPPHEFAVNVPNTMAQIRSMSYRQYAWPTFLSNAFNRRGVATSLGIAATIATFLLICSGAFAHLGPASDFYQIIPHRRLAMGFGVVSLIVAVLLFAGFVRFWRDVGETFSDLVKPKALTSALDDILSLRYLGSGGVGCTDNAGRHSPWRRYFHQLTFYGFMLCFAATCAGTFDHYVLHEYAPYPLLSTPVILGTLGGIGLLIGPAGLYLLKHRAPQPKIEADTSSMDTSFIVLLFSTSATGLVLLALRNSHFMGEWLCIHLALVMTLFLTLPYGKFVHGIYRSAALVKYALERARPRYRLSD